MKEESSTANWTELRCVEFHKEESYTIFVRYRFSEDFPSVYYEKAAKNCSPFNPNWISIAQKKLQYLLPSTKASNNSARNSLFHIVIVKGRPLKLSMALTHHSVSWGNASCARALGQQQALTRAHARQLATWGRKDIRRQPEVRRSRKLLAVQRAAPELCAGTRVASLSFRW